MSVNFATSSTVDTADFVRSSHHTILLFDYVPKPPTVLPYQSKNFLIQKDDFINLFYKNKGKFLFALENNLENILGSKTKLNGWAKSTAEEENLTSITYDIVSDIVSLWQTDTGINKSDWSSSSYINIVSDLLRVNDWTNLKFSNTLSYQEILSLLNQTELESSNILKLSIIVDNDNTNADPVELILNFEIA